MRIALVDDSWALKDGNLNTQAEPFSIEVLASELIKRGDEVSLFQRRNQTYEEYAKTILNTKPDTVGISANYISKIQEFLQISRLLKESNKDCVIIWGGYVPTLEQRVFGH